MAATPTTAAKTAKDKAAFDPAALIAATEDTELSALPARAHNRQADPAIAYFDSLVQTAPRDKARKYYTTKEQVTGLAHRFGRAIGRCKLRDVFTAESGQESDGRYFVVLRPKRAKKTEGAS